MIGNSVNYDKKYKENQSIWGTAKLDDSLKRYLKLLDGKNVLDLGIGEGNNSISLSNLGFNVTGIDSSKKALDICKSNSNNIKLINDDIRNYKIAKDEFNLILSRYALHFLHKDEVLTIVNEIKENLSVNGLVYIAVFSTSDPGNSRLYSNPNYEYVSNNIFHDKVNNTYMSYFSQPEILDLFSGFETILISEEYSLDLGHDAPHYHGVIKYIGRKL